MKEINMVDIGKRIKELRVAQHIKQADLANAIGVATNTVCQYEKGTSKLSIDVLINLAEFFDISTDYLLCLID